MAGIFLLEELSQKINVPGTVILNWEKEKLIKAAGYTEEKIPFFTADVIEDCQTIIKLSELGYQLPEIGRIIKKVGLPSSKESNEKIKVKEKLLTVGELAEKINVSSRTIKHWEDKGIIEADMRSEGGYRLYSEIYVFLCSLIQDLQNFGYTLDEIKTISEFFRSFLALQSNLENYSQEEAGAMLDQMSQEIERLFETMKKLKSGIERWEELLKSKKKEITSLKTKNTKRK